MDAERVEFHEGAIDDVKAAVASYRERSPKAAAEFLEEVDQAIATNYRNAESMA
jgi:hypothetical protein